MRNRKLLSSFIVASAVVLHAAIAAANGHSVAVRATDVAVNASFEDRSGTKHLWSKAKVGVPDDYRETLNARAGEATSEVPLSKISKVVFLDDKPNADGFVKATILLTDGSKETYEVRVEEKNQPIRLIGYDKAASSDIVLIKCKYIEFSAKTAGSSEEPSHQPAVAE